jgi:hypothetical protein
VDRVILEHVDLGSMHGSSSLLCNAKYYPPCSRGQ